MPDPTVFDSMWQMATSDFCVGFYCGLFAALVMRVEEVSRGRW